MSQTTNNEKGNVELVDVAVKPTTEEKPAPKKEDVDM